MNAIIKSKRMVRLVLPVIAAAGVLSSAPRADAQLMYGPEIAKAAPPGLGDLGNTIIWGMAWWQNKLYVGTGRATFCVQQATLQFYNPDKNFYPPKDPAFNCTPDAHDLDLQAEIWRFTPAATGPGGTWDMVYQAPNDVPIQGTSPQKYTARDIGYRGMTVFKEADGTEALYVSGDSTRGGPGGEGFDGPVPPPRILRSTDGTHFDAVPFDPDAVLGQQLICGFRSLKTYKGKLYAMGTVGQLGHGVLLEATNPELGLFRQVSGLRPDGKPLTFFEIEVYNGFLYGGTGVQPQNDPTPFSLMKTDATGDPPYTFTTVVPEGAYKKRKPSPAVISMAVFQNRLYFGTDKELLRVNPDDTWDLVVGQPRKRPDGTKLEPLAGFEEGFDNFFNIHMWRMAVNPSAPPGQWLYIGTHDQSAKWRKIKGIGNQLKPIMGFDIFATNDGWHYTAVTLNGLGDVLNNGLRNFAPTPRGLFMGTANHYNGAEVYQAIDQPRPIAAPVRLEAESGPKIAGLTWEGSPTATKFHVYRAAGWEDPVEVKVTDAAAPDGHGFADTTLKMFKNYRYFVVAEDAMGNLSEPSNMVRAPFKGPVPTFKSMETLLTGWTAPVALTTPLAEAKTAVLAAETDPTQWTVALAKLQAMGALVAPPTQTLLLPYRAQDLGVLLLKFSRRVVLAQAGALPPKLLMK